MCQVETPPLIIYSYIWVIILSLITAFSIIYKKMKYSLNRNAFYFILIIALWTLGDLAQWMVQGEKINHAFFHLSFLIDFFFLFFLYFSYDYAGEKLSWKRKIIFALPLAVTVFCVIFGKGIGDIDDATCCYKPSWLMYYSLLLDTVYSVWSSAVLIKKYKEPTIAYKEKLQIRLLVFSILFFVFWSIAYEAVNIFSVMEKLEIEISPYFILGNLFFVTLIVFNIIEYELFDFDLIPGKCFSFIVFSVIFLGMFFLSLTPMFYLILLIFYIAVIWVFWGK